MAVIQTNRFGVLPYDAKEVLFFQAGLPGFEEEHEFIAVIQATLRPLVFLQSVRRADLCLPTLPARLVCPSFELRVEEDELSSAGVASSSGKLLYLAIVTIGGGALPTANLAAPVIIDTTSRRAAQIICSISTYSIRHPVPQEALQCS